MFVVCFLMTISCDNCSSNMESFTGKNKSEVLQHAKTTGWFVGRSTQLCPTCRKKENDWKKLRLEQAGLSTKGFD